MSKHLPISHHDVIVIGAGHAGCEAGLAAARAGCSTLVVTPVLDRIGYMPCNPSIGGPGKGHIVVEIDALGGGMGRAADRAALQIRQLNTSKGPAVQALRAQEDKGLYALAMKESLENQVGIALLQDEALGLILEEGRDNRPRVAGVVTRNQGRIHADAVVITAGTFLRGRMVSGESSLEGGRSGERADRELAGSLLDMGFQLRRLKTGTPPRIDARTVDFGAGEIQCGSDEPLYFSRDAREGGLEPLSLPPLPNLVEALGQVSAWRPQLACLRLGTNKRTHDLIRQNLDRAPMFNGSIQGLGPRYCPSIEDKVARFGEKDTHPLFLEPEGWRTTELYVQGFSTSLPPEVQTLAMQTVSGLENARITRYGYAVEYDAVDPSEIDFSLASRRVDGLFLAGQVNGTSGYEEAAGQGLVAGLNAANHVRGKEAVVLRRDQAYIGVMIDDLVSKPFDEPYRMLTSRAEHRLLLRPDTADQRLSSIAWREGLITAERRASVEAEGSAVDSLLFELSSLWISPNDTWRHALQLSELSPVARPMTALDLLRRPEVSMDNLAVVLAAAGHSSSIEPGARVNSLVEAEAKYGAFIARDRREAARLGRLEEIGLSPDLDFAALPGLRIEARQKLTQHRPTTIAQAGRLAGVTPSDVAALLVHARRSSPVRR